MPIHVSLPAQLVEMAGGAEELVLEGGTIGAVLDVLARQHPRFRTLLWSRDGGLNPVIVYFINGKQVRAGEVPNASLQDGDELLLVSAVEGG